MSAHQTSRSGKTGLSDFTPHLGLAAYFRTALVAESDACKGVALRLVDSRWPWVPTLGTLSLVGTRKKQKIRIRKGDATILESQIASPTFHRISTGVSNREANNHAHAYLDTGAKVREYQVPFTAQLQTRAFVLPSGKVIHDWLALVDELLVILNAQHAVLCAYTTADATLSDISLMEIFVDDVARHASSTELHRASFWRDLLGGQYVRHPRWRTYLLPVHLDRIGGLERIEREICPDMTKEVGELICIQLTSFENCLSSECEQKRQLLAEIMAPIVVPEVPE